jgi:hypothetical protein
VSCRAARRGSGTGARSAALQRMLVMASNGSSSCCAAACSCPHAHTHTTAPCPPPPGETQTHLLLDARRAAPACRTPSRASPSTRT